MARYVPADLAAVLAQLEGENDRAVALLGATLIEHYLEKAIKAKLRPIDENTSEGRDDLDRLYGPNGAFAGLSLKIVGAYALRIIGPERRRDLELINKIRNQFAHDMNPISFETGSIKDRCREIGLTKNITSEDTPRNRYLLSVRAKRWSHFLRQPAKVDSTMQRTIHHEDAETVFGGVQGQGRT
jgi:DNA-binding MltR family transcriptional regulator